VSARAAQCGMVVCSVGFCLVLAAASLWAFPVTAEESGTFSLQFENDRVAATDRHYTHGSRISWVSKKKYGAGNAKEMEGTNWARNLLDFLYPLAKVRTGRIGFALGQNIYTPEDTSTTALVVEDRPYAGWLYGAVSLHAETPRRFFGHDAKALDSVELSAGIVGPQAYGEDVQNNVHDLIGVARSNGWNNQLKNEPAVALFFERKLRPAPTRFAGMEADVIPHFGGSVGNVFTMGNIGATFRIGQQLGLDYGPPHIRPTLSGLAAVESNDKLGWYFFAGGEGRAVLRNIFLDGNTFADSHNIRKKPFVGSLQFGFSLAYKGARLAFSHVFLSKEFDTQRRSDRYGAITLSKNF
jgi:lipid A 3-O-deacylase